MIKYAKPTTKTNMARVGIVTTIGWGLQVALPRDFRSIVLVMRSRANLHTRNVDLEEFAIQILIILCCRFQDPLHGR